MDKLRAKLHVKHELGRALLAEFTGTFLLLLVLNSVVAQAVLPKNKGVLGNETIGVNIGIGIAIWFGVAISARLSGGHINPAVSAMFALFGQLSPVRFLLYFVVQLLGALFGSAVAYAVYQDAIFGFDGGNHQIVGNSATAGIFASYPAVPVGLFNGFLNQMVATAVFCFLIAHITDKRNAYPSWVQPVLIGVTFVGIGTAFAYNDGYPCNPARDLGPRLFTFIWGYGGEVFSHRTWSWVPVIAPLVGGILGGLLYQLLIGFHTPQDVEEKYVVLTGNQELKPLTSKDPEESAQA